MRARPLVRTLAVLSGLIPPLWMAPGVPVRAEGAEAPSLRSRPAARFAAVPADSLDRRLKTLLASDSLDLDSLERLLREDTLAHDRTRDSGAANGSSPAVAPGGAVRPDSMASPTAAPGPSGAGVEAARRLFARDSVSVRWELGASSDVIDEQFYEYRDEVFDTLSRVQVSEPETRVGGVFALAAEGTRGRGRVRWRFHDETSIGDLLQRTTLDLHWQQDPAARWRVILSPWLDLRHDRTFGRDLNEAHGLGSVRLVRELSEDSDLELGARGELLRTSGTGTDLLLDRDAVTLSAAWDRLPWWGDEARVGYAFTARQFPDSLVRDHFEHAGEASWRHLLPGSGWIGLDADGERRVTVHGVPSTRDNFWRTRLAGDLEAGIGERGWVKGRVEGEQLLYDVPDSLVYGDELLLRAALLPGLRHGPGRSIVIGPRFERLRSRQQPAEDYDEIAAAAELEWSSARTFWSATPAAGRRRYRQPLDHQRVVTTGLHSHYDYVELGVIADQRLPGSLRLRGFVDGRLESHTDSADDSRSLYFSLDLRMLF
jgi:hypothetical protein